MEKTALLPTNFQEVQQAIEIPVKRKQRKSLQPKNTVDIVAVAKSVALTWETSIFVISLVTAAYLKDKTLMLEAILLSKQTKRSSNSPDVEELSQLKKSGDLALGKVKHLIRAKFPQKTAISLFPEFGIIYANRLYCFPEAHDARIPSLKMMLQALLKYGLGDGDYGLMFWEQHLERYVELAGQTRETVKETTTDLSQEIALKAEVQEILVAVERMLESECRDGDPIKLKRSWGFLRERN